MTAPLEPLTVGSLCTGYLGADAALHAALGTRTIWVADNDPDVATLLAARFPGPNLGDIRRVDWQKVARPAIICAGFPCQDISPAGRRAGIAPGTRSGLWTWIAYVIDTLKPEYVFIENSRGLTSARAHSDVESCPWCMGAGERKPALRALGRVLGDLAARGYDAEWCVVRASDVGCPHERARAFIWAWRREVADPGCLAYRGGEPRGVAGAPSAGGGQAVQRQRVRADDWDGGASAADPSGERHHRGRDGGRRAAAIGQQTGGGAADGSGAPAHPAGEPSGEPADQADAVASGGRARSVPRRRGGRDGPRGRPAADADREPGTGQLGGDTAAAEDRGQAADAGGAGLAVGAVEPARHERAPAARGGRNRAGDPEGERRQRAGAARDQGRATGSAHERGADAEPEGERRCQGQPESARVVGGSDAALGGAPPAADPGGERGQCGHGEPLGGEDRRTAAGGDRAAGGEPDRPGRPERAGADGWGGFPVLRGDGDSPEGMRWRVGRYDYTQAIRAWEAITGRAAPLATHANGRGEPRLNPELSEWMMALPRGWVTAVPGLGRPAMLRIIGNGLVPPQGALAVDILTARAAEDSAADLRAEPPPVIL